MYLLLIRHYALKMVYLKCFDVQVLSQEHWQFYHGRLLAPLLQILGDTSLNIPSNLPPLWQFGHEPIHFGSICCCWKCQFIMEVSCYHVIFVEVW